MNTNSYQITLSYQQILELVKQLPKGEKVKLSEELVKETTDETLSRLLKLFRTDEISQEEIDTEVESVRSEIYAKGKD
jgi:hypothetical protein